MNRRHVLAAASVALLRPGSADAARALPPPLQLLRPVEPRRQVTGLEMKTASGGTLALETIRGRTVVLNVWASWCFPCRDEMPGLSRLAAASDQALCTVLPMAIERHGADAVKDFYQKMGIGNLPVVLGEGRNVAKVFAEWGIPFTVLIDGSGREFGRVTGAARWDDPAFIRWLGEQRES